MWTLIQFLLFFYLALLGFFRIHHFFTAPLSHIPGTVQADELPKNSTIDTLPLSVIIPARNEEHRLPILLESLKQQRQKPHEIIVVDDGSTDGTAEIARRYGCRVVHPDGSDWSGKSAACYAGAKVATGAYIVFFDADVFLAADALAYIYQHRQKGGVLSIQPYHYMEKLYEQCSLYCNLVAILGLDLGQRKKPFSTKLGFFGPCVLMDRETYLFTGGHALVRNSILEDMALGQALVKRNIPLIAIPHNNQISFRMYAEGFKKLFNGWSKNMGVAAQRSSIWTILIISSIIALSIFIPGQLLKSILGGTMLLNMVYSGAYLVFAGLLFLSARRIGSFSVISCLLFPLLALFFVLVLLRSLFMQIFKLPIDWRGRKVHIQ
ncbi:MAG TPA: glycosyltransferase family 2 protein [Spirochaetia bacterium]|nr:glycosyltransferase family 2 protein [Spirochaetales bacterium]HPD80716.1 glycosyltransferase family 2 protein [Spirochaetales bacterium]HRS64377.1 glycosyltransferase family 2 protein [Spirochaetia bacterium]